MNRMVTIDVNNQYLHFSSAHFTIFSATDRERLHGHNFSVRARARSKVEGNGLAFDYNELKQALYSICQTLDEYTLIAQNSPYLNISESDEYFEVIHNDQKMFFLKTDTLLLPLLNITLEELSGYLLSNLISSGLVKNAGIEYLELEIGSGPGQRVSSVYEVG